MKISSIIATMVCSIAVAAMERTEKRLTSNWTPGGAQAAVTSSGSYLHRKLKRTKSNRKSTKRRGEKPSPVTSIGNIRPEGITEGPGSTLFFSHFFFGGISSFDARTGQIEDIVADKDFLQRGGIGLSYYKEALFAGGGGPMGLLPKAEVYVYDVKTGEEIVACEPLQTGSFMNEVTIKGNKAYITDSGQAKLMVMDADAALLGECDITSIDLPEDFNVDGDDWGANGIAPYCDGLIIVTETRGSVYFLDLTDESVSKIVDDGEVVYADGLVVFENKMYITHNYVGNKVSVWALSGGSNGEPVVAIKEGEMTSPYYQSPATSAIYGGYIYSVNARFDTLGFPEDGEGDPDFSEEFHIVAVRNVFGDVCEA